MRIDVLENFLRWKPIPMHELSIASHLLEVALDYIQDLHSIRVERIRLKIGALTAVHQDSLRFSFEMVSAGTPLAGAELHVEWLPIVIYCETCDELRQLSGIQSLECPICNGVSFDIRQGRELDLEFLEYIEMDANRCVSSSTQESPS